MYGFDWTYLVLVLPCVIFSMWASSKVNSTFKKYSTQYSARRLTGAQAAQRVLSANGVCGVRIERISGRMLPEWEGVGDTPYWSFAQQMLEQKFLYEGRTAANHYFSAEHLKQRYERGENHLRSQW